MASLSTQVDVSKLNLDLKNYRATPQSTEEDAVKVMIAISPDRFWALAQSILEDGYLHTENIITIDSGKKVNKLIVKEGNRRIAILKMAHGHFKLNKFLIPDDVRKQFESVTAKWKKENLLIPCSCYKATDFEIVDKIVNLAHGKGEKASRDKWTSVATARHNRAVNKASEPALDLLEKYLVSGKNITTHQKELWVGDYPLTVLQDAIGRMYARFELKSTVELAAKYPAVKYRTQLEAILNGIGAKSIGFSEVRSENPELCDSYSIPRLPSAVSPTTGSAAGVSTAGAAATSGTATTGTVTGAVTGTTGTSPTTTVSAGVSTSSTSKAFALNDPKSVAKILRRLQPTTLVWAY